MKVLSTVLATAVLANSAMAHFTLQYAWLNGKDSGQNTYLRVPPTNNPVTDVTSTDITCNVGGTSGSGVATGTIAAGQQVTLEWHQHAQRTGEDAISGGHKGAVQVYIAKAPSTAASFNGQGAVWTKVYSSGLLNPSSQQWATDVVNSNGGKHSFTLPASIPAGEYLIRGEIIALHVSQTYPGAQFYIGCAQVKVTGGGSANPPKVSLPGAYKGSDPGITVNIYNNLQSYTAPGPAVWSG
ncbi:glycoside hydrolase family 61 protein [Botryobasidium botryosum FD-172 SS1]|uniref:AA9 family lytic polysaccharide monooxygenase n=1 Tax=Botryobasidium botryosum (strain FD-172 SS1) TaxID=930990 RepID=A0A067MIV4_BOTB1|nr:glycoside hydrolase family 61 protein [Botryobasidium botryosum FD-172 SS1]